jgi:hypothetical protein
MFMVLLSKTLDPQLFLQSLQKLLLSKIPGAAQPRFQLVIPQPVKQEVLELRQPQISPDLRTGDSLSCSIFKAHHTPLQLRSGSQNMVALSPQTNKAIVNYLGESQWVQLLQPRRFCRLTFQHQGSNGLHLFHGYETPANLRCKLQIAPV